MAKLVVSFKSTPEDDELFNDISSHSNVSGYVKDCLRELKELKKILGLDGNSDVLKQHYVNQINKRQEDEPKQVQTSVQVLEQANNVVQNNTTSEVKEEEEIIIIPASTPKQDTQVQVEEVEEPVETSKSNTVISKMMNNEFSFNE